MTEQPYKSINYPDPEETRTATNPYTGNPVEKPFYRFFAIDHFETGCGRNIWLQISLYKLDEDRDYNFIKFANFVNEDYHLRGCDELTEQEFLDRYTRLLPDMTVHMMREKSLTIFQTHLHFNRS